jgi:hypothetical protein
MGPFRQHYFPYLKGIPMKTSAFVAITLAFGMAAGSALMAQKTPAKAPNKTASTTATMPTHAPEAGHAHTRTAHVHKAAHHHAKVKASKSTDANSSK